MWQAQYYNEPNAFETMPNPGWKIWHYSMKWCRFNFAAETFWRMMIFYEINVALLALNSMKSCQQWNKTFLYFNKILGLFVWLIVVLNWEMWSWFQWHRTINWLDIFHLNWNNSLAHKWCEAFLRAELIWGKQQQCMLIDIASELCDTLSLN